MQCVSTGGRVSSAVLVRAPCVRGWVDRRCSEMLSVVAWLLVGSGLHIADEQPSSETARSFYDRDLLHICS